MAYRKIKTVSLHSNSEKNLVLRQRWALEFLALGRKRKVVLNVDETWLGMSDFRRRKWQAPGTTNSVAKLEVAPRITMILGLDTLGNVYVALAQANSNSQMMELYFRSLAARLAQGHRDYRGRRQVPPVEGLPGGGRRAPAALHAPGAPQLRRRPLRAGLRALQEGRRQPSACADGQEVSSLSSL